MSIKPIKPTELINRKSSRAAAVRDLSNFVNPPRTSAKSDLELLVEWIRLANTKSLELQRIRESRRLLIWMDINDLTLPELTITEVQAYFKFMENPPPDLVGPSRPYQIDGSTNPAWRPFTGPITKSSTYNQARVILNSLFEYAANTNWILTNPIRLLPAKRFQTLHASRTKVLSDKTVIFIQRSLILMPDQTLYHRQLRSRALLIFNLLLLSGLRREELTTLKMGNFIRKDGAWWVNVTGKGSKEGRVPLPSSAIPYISEYRESFGFGFTMPSPDEKSPLLFTVKGKTIAPMSYSALYAEIKGRLAQFAKQTVDPEILQDLHQASTHWLRHTYATTALKKGMPLKHLQDNMRHASISTTEGYIHLLDSERAASTSVLDD